MNENVPAHCFLDLAINESASDFSSLSTVNRRLIAAAKNAQPQELFDHLLQ